MADAVPIRVESDVIAARQLVRRLAGEMGFSLVDQTKLVTAASELGRNVVRYGKGGEMRWEKLTNGSRSGLRLVFEDHGPGIPDVAKAMTDGWTSANGLGMGLGGTRRLVNEFDLYTEVGKGTRVTIARWR